VNSGSGGTNGPPYSSDYNTIVDAVEDETLSSVT